MTSRHVRYIREFPDNNNHKGVQSTLVACGPLKTSYFVSEWLGSLFRDFRDGQYMARKSIQWQNYVTKPTYKPVYRKNKR